MIDRVRGFKALVHDAVDFAVDMVATGHASAARTAMRVLGVIAPDAVVPHVVDEIRRATTAHTLDSIRAVNRLVQSLTDSGIDAATASALLPWLDREPDPVPLRSDTVGSRTWVADGAIGALNGIVGDYLHASHNALDLGFSLRSGNRFFRVDKGGAPFVFDPGAKRIAVYVHGLSATEWSWCWDAAAYHGDPAHHFASMLERDAGLVPVYARYNSGRRVFENGALLADAIEQLCNAQETPVEEIVLVGHSMGGLVVRSACHVASTRGMKWVAKVTQVFCLGSPHRGAPLEKFGRIVTDGLGRVDHPATKITAEILRRRSAGIRDLHDGTLLDDGDLAKDERALTEVPLLDHAAYHFVSATITRDPSHPLAHLVGDVLVRVPSATGPVVQSRTFGIETATFGGIAHHQLQNHPDVYAWVKRACLASVETVGSDATEAPASRGS